MRLREYWAENDRKKEAEEDDTDRKYKMTKWTPPKHSDAVGVHEWPSILKGPKTQVYLIE